MKANQISVHNFTILKKTLQLLHMYLTSVPPLYDLIKIIWNIYSIIRITGLPTANTPEFALM